MEAIRETLGGLLKELKARKDNEGRLDPSQLAKQVFSRKEAQHILVGNLKSGTLYIKVDSSAWLYYFNLHKNEILGKFSATGSPVKDLKFNLGAIARKIRSRKEKILQEKG